MIIYKQAPDDLYNIEVKIGGSVENLLCKITDEQMEDVILEELEAGLQLLLNMKNIKVYGLTKVKEIIRVQ